MMEISDAAFRPERRKKLSTGVVNGFLLLRKSIWFQADMKNGSNQGITGFKPI